MLLFLASSNHMGFMVGFYISEQVIDVFRLLIDGSGNRWLLLLLVAPKAPFFTILFSCCIVFLMILSVILPFIWQPSPLQHWGPDKYKKKLKKIGDRTF